jgi:hypothetical protein
MEERQRTFELVADLRDECHGKAPPAGYRSTQRSKGGRA